MKKFFLTGVLLVLSLMTSAQTKKVALLEPLNGDKAVPVKGIEKNMVRGELRKALSNQPGIQAFTRTDIDQLMKELNFQNSGMVSDAQRKKLGEMASADYICVSKVSKSNKEFYLEAYLIDVETGEITNPASQYGQLEGGTYANLYQICQDLAQELIGNVGVGSKSAVITIKVDNFSFEMVKVEAGSFYLGNGLSNRVTITRDYYIGKYEVTQGLYDMVMGVNPSCFKGYDRPVEQVSWNDAEEFCAKLSRMTGRHFSLPTDAEWEYAARGGKKTKGYEYAGSSDPNEVGWYYKNSEQQTHPVGRLKPNELGIYDMCGNVAEWCQDWYSEYPDKEQTDPMGAAKGTHKVERNGGFSAFVLSSIISRFGTLPDKTSSRLGFRVVMH